MSRDTGQLIAEAFGVRPPDDRPLVPESTHTMLGIPIIYDDTMTLGAWRLVEVLRSGSVC